MTEEIKLERVCNKISWGFRLTGGRDFSSPLTVSRIQGGSVAEKGGLKVGDIITDIGGEKTNHLTHAEALRCVIDSGNVLNVKVLRGSCPDVQRAFTPIRGITPASLFDIEEKKKTTSTISVSSVNSLYEDDSFELLEQSDDEFLDEYHEPTEEEIEEMLLENAEVLEENGKNVIGVNFRRFIPKCDFIKDSAVFAVLQEEQVHKELSEKEQLAKCPNKRFSTFLAPPDRPIPTPRRPAKKQDKQNAEISSRSEQNITEESPKLQVCSYQKNAAGDENSENTVCEVTKKSESETAENENSVTRESCNNESENSVKETGPVHENSQNTEGTSSEVHDVQIQEVKEDTLMTETNTEDTNDFKVQLNNIKNTLNTLGQLPSLIQSQLENIQSQINDLIKLKEGHAKEHTPAVEEQTAESSIPQQEMGNADQPIIEEFEDDTEDSELYSDYDAESNDESEVQNEENDTEKQPSEEAANNEKHDQEESRNVEEQNLRKRRICPLTPLPRPVVLPGGRMWRKPQDAYNEEFIAETLISQAEVLVGSTLGVNFRKYEPPKFDLSNSAVYKLIHNLESKKGGLENRDTIPALQDYYQSPISARTFYLSKLIDKANQPQETGN